MLFRVPIFAFFMSQNRKKGGVRHRETQRQPNNQGNQTMKNKNNNGTGKKTLNEVTKGMVVQSWEVREGSNGSHKVYVRFAPKKPTVTITVND